MRYVLLLLICFFLFVLTGFVLSSRSVDRETIDNKITIGMSKAAVIELVGMPPDSAVDLTKVVMGGEDFRYSQAKLELVWYLNDWTLIVLFDGRDRVLGRAHWWPSSEGSNPFNRFLAYVQRLL